MGREMMSDLNVASNGHCFLCLNQVMAHKHGLSLAPPLRQQITSLQYLSRYLKMNLKKVFIGKGQVPPELLAKVGRARLKVELCEECRCLNERFSEVYRQLEKLEMELGSTLSLIHGKLEGSDTINKRRTLTDDSSSNWNGVFEVLNVLRAEVVQKSSRKLMKMPRVKIQSLAKKEIKAKQFILDNIPRRKQKTTSQLATSSNFLSGCGLEMSVKMESLNDNEEYLFDDNTPSNIEQENIEDNDAVPIPIMENLESDPHAGHSDVSEDMKVDVYRKVVSGSDLSLLRIQQWSINPETGKKKCDSCPREYGSSCAFRNHYRTVHLKQRYKCISCNKLFSFMQNLRRHQITSQSCSRAESAPKYNCHLCEKKFKRKAHLQEHLDGVHYKLGKFECDLCKKKFDVKTYLNAHKRKFHGRGKTSKKCKD